MKIKPPVEVIKHPRVWVTKYLFTRGILEFANGESSMRSPSMVTVPDKASWSGKTHFHGGDWHTSKKDAIAKARKMASRKRCSLAEQLKELDHLIADLEDEAL